MNRKVVYNDCYGGFFLSEEAKELGRQISGDKKWRAEYLPRHDLVLVEVVEKLGCKASGEFSCLRIAEVVGKYRIDEYDGAESVETPESYDWVE